MHFSVHDYQSQRPPEPPAMVRTVSRSDVLWNRPVFKAPPLEVAGPKLDAKTVMEELRRAVRSER